MKATTSICVILVTAALALGDGASLLEGAQKGGYRYGDGAQYLRHEEGAQTGDM